MKRILIAVISIFMFCSFAHADPLNCEALSNSARMTYYLKTQGYTYQMSMQILNESKLGQNRADPVYKIGHAIIDRIYFDANLNINKFAAQLMLQCVRANQEQGLM